MSQEEIVIKTETVKVEELQGREKQIYDYAYKKGVEDAKSQQEDDKWWPLRLVIALGAVALFIYMFIKAY